MATTSAALSVAAAPAAAVAGGRATITTPATRSLAAHRVAHAFFFFFSYLYTFEACLGFGNLMHAGRSGTPACSEVGSCRRCRGSVMSAVENGRSLS